MNREQTHILDDIFKTLTNSESPEQSLERIVQMITERFSTDVCSVYAYDMLENKLVLKATRGLRPESVGAIEMDVNEGLTGLVVETLSAVFVRNPSSHPRFKYYADSGEEIYRTFLGLPLIFYQKVLGVLVIQTVNEQGISERDIPLFRNIASQISATLAYTGLMEDRSHKRLSPFYEEKSLRPAEGPDDKTRRIKEDYLRGAPVSESVSEGFAYYLPEMIRFEQVQPVRQDDPEFEIKRLDIAFENSSHQIQNITNESIGISDQDKAIIEVQLLLLHDKSLKEKITAKINDGYCAEYALKQVIMLHVEMFEAMDDPYLSERSADVLDIGRRVLANLLGVGEDQKQGFERDTIVIASDISAVQLLTIRQPNLKGIVLAKGGRTSHTVILANSLEIPIVISVDGLLENVRQGDYLIIDCSSGFVYPNPSQEIRKEYRRRKAGAEQEYNKLLRLKDVPAVTKDGYLVRLGANIGLLSDITLVEKYGADHVGLYRTEFPFLVRKSFPNEEEQVSLYTRVLQKCGNRSVTIRTLDAGGDKLLPYLDYPREDNPFLGWRSIRISLDMEDVFRTQIRSILRASAFGKAKILFPMISGLEEIKQVTALVNSEKKSLEEENIPFDNNIPLGIMVEVPAAVTILDRFLRYVDFVSIGTNDLIQYLLAVDRNNTKVSARYNALHPSVISTIHEIMSVCRKFKKTVEICGEAASSPACILLFIAMGAENISMNASSIPVAKKTIRNITLSNAQEALEKVIEMDDAQAIGNYLEKLLHRT